ncbi:MAG: rod shape-determining protein MreD [Chloroflexi bacterium]|nr:rod shape-determining protein MreD [Chloroflexota bacterium]
MSLYAAVALLGLLAILQSSILTRVDPSTLHPDVMLLTIVAWALQRGSREGLVWGFFGGLALDVVSGVPLGLNALVLTAAGYLAGLGEARVFRTNFVLPVLIIAALTVVVFAAHCAYLLLSGNALALDSAIISILAPSLVLNLIASPLVFRPIRWLSRSYGREQLRW